MLKPVGARCNLACEYCYYLEKQHLYDDEPRHVMSEELLERFIQEYIGAQMSDEVLFTWHGGETMMRPLSFYRRAIELQQKYANNDPTQKGHQYVRRVRSSLGVVWRLTQRSSLDFYYRFNYGYDRDVTLKANSQKLLLTEETSYQHVIGIAYNFGW